MAKFLAAILALLVSVPALANPSHGFIRGVEGDANLLSGGGAQTIAASINYPIQVGDELLVAAGGRMEVVLADASILRLDGNTQLRFSRLAESIDSHDDRTLLQLLQGQIQITLAADPPHLEGFRIDTANASVYLLSSGSFRIFTDGKSWTQAIARQGYLDVETEEGVDRVGPGQQAVVDGYPAPRLTIQAAAPIDELEQWALRLQRQATTREAQGPYRRGNLSSRYDYVTAPLSRYGRWTSYGGSDVWRPHVPYGWRPYHSGWWIYTPIGLTWISTEPWGWVPYHYGYWGLAGDIGWVWYPGHQYTPGAVYWYWGPSYVGWIPRGHYSPYFNASFPCWPPYGHYGGFASHYNDRHRLMNDWTFSSYEQFGYRDSHRYLKTGAELGNHGVFRSDVRQGVITTDTRNLTPNLWNQPDRIRSTLVNPRSMRSTTRTRPLASSPYRRDSRLSPSRWRGQEASPMTRNSWSPGPTPGRIGSPYGSITGRSRPGGALARPGVSTGRAPVPGRSSTARPGSAASGRTMGGGASRSTSGKPGSG